LKRNNKSYPTTVAWHYGNSTKTGGYFSERSSKEVGRKLPNELDLFDMSGNVWEWCTDSNKAIRGGSYEDSLSYLWVISRRTELPNISSKSIGFRICITGNHEANHDYEETASSAEQSFNTDTLQSLNTAIYKNAFLGLTLSDIVDADRDRLCLPKELCGVILRSVYSEGIGNRLGFSEDDVITRVSINGNQESIDGLVSFRNVADSIKKGDYMAFFGYRSGIRFVASFQY